MKISELKHFENNPRTITKIELDKLKASIKEYSKHLKDWDIKDGYRLVQSITVNDIGNECVGGNMRLIAI